MKVGDWVVEKDHVGWKVSDGEKASERKDHRADWHYFGRLEHVAGFMAESEARELSIAVESVQEMRARLCQRLQELLSEEIRPTGQAESRSRRASL